jgi:hypothetical protein
MGFFYCLKINEVLTICRLDGAYGIEDFGFNYPRFHYNTSGLFIWVSLLLKLVRNLINKKLLVALAISAIYPAFVLSYVWSHCLLSDFQGGKNGQLDAYRHTLASAVVAYTASPKVVGLVTSVMEFRRKSSSLMDRHNNLIGAKIGLEAKSFAQINGQVVQYVKNGTENAVYSSQITWLKKSHWKKSLFW